MVGDDILHCHVTLDRELLGTNYPEIIKNFKIQRGRIGLFSGAFHNLVSLFLLRRNAQDEG